MSALLNVSAGCDNPRFKQVACFNYIFPAQGKPKDYEERPLCLVLREAGRMSHFAQFTWVGTQPGGY